MKKLVKRVLAVMAAVVITVSSVPTSVYAETRKTDIFEDYEHGTTSFSDMKYEPIDTAKFAKMMGEIRSLYSKSSNESKVKERYEMIKELYMDAIGVYYYTNVMCSIDVTDEKMSENYLSTYEAIQKMEEEVKLLFKDILNSECDSFLREILSDQDIAAFLSYSPMSKKEKELFQLEQEQILEYQKLAIQPYNGTYKGKKYTIDSLTKAYNDGKITDDVYNTVVAEIMKKMNKTLGEHYLKMVETRNKISSNSNYKNYGDYCYEMLYGRDYSQAEIKKFHKAVKENISPLYATVATLLQYSMQDPVFYQDYTEEKGIAILKEYIPQISSEMEESLNYMIKYELYDLAYSSVKASGAFTTILPSYQSPFLFMQPTFSMYDFSTAVHEFGHYNAFYYNALTFDNMGTNIDVAEIHSQGLELLFSQLYPQIFGSSAQNAEYYLMTNLLSAMVQGCLMDELQQYVYAEKNLTLEKINKQYMKLLKEYGLAESEDKRTEAYGWVQIPHTFQSPFYYISYAVSAAAAFEIWEESENDFEGAADRYLELVSKGTAGYFLETLYDVGYENPLTKEYMEGLSEDIYQSMDLDAKLVELLELFYSSQKDTDDVKKSDGKDTKTDKAGNVSDPKKEDVKKDPKDTKDENSNIIKYTVKKGDSIYKIAQSYGIDWKRIVKKNNLKAPYTIYVGQVLLIER